MLEFTFGVELCLEEWQDLVRINHMYHLLRKRFVPSIPIPILGFHMMLPFLTTVRNIQTTLQVQTSLLQIHIYAYFLPFLNSLTLYPN